MPAPTPRLEPCPGCGALYPPSEGATHPYIGASAGCWALHGPMSAGQQPDERLLAESRVPSRPVRHGAAASAARGASLLVDAYAAQHPGVPSPQSIQSVAVHLLTLHGVLRRGLDPSRALWIRLRAVRFAGVFGGSAPGSGRHHPHLFPGGGGPRSRRGAYSESVFSTWEILHRLDTDV